MAVINITVTPQFGPGGSPIVLYTDDNTRYTPVKLSVPAGQTYATADQCALVWNGGGDFFAHYGVRIIKQVLAEPIACDNVSFGILVPVWGFAAQRLRFLRAGNGGAVVPTGPLNNTQVADGTALGNSLMTCNALIFF